MQAENSEDGDSEMLLPLHEDDLAITESRLWSKPARHRQGNVSISIYA